MTLFLLILTKMLLFLLVFDGVYAIFFSNGFLIFN